MPNPTAAMLVIGDEILSGRTRDANMHYLAGELTGAGIDLKEVRIVSDTAPDIVAAVQDLAARYAHIFTSGGIGPTHDDITADCIAEAFEKSIDVRADAKARRRRRSGGRSGGSARHYRFVQKGQAERRVATIGKQGERGVAQWPSAGRRR